MEKRMADSKAAMQAEEGRAAATKAQAQEAKARTGRRPPQGMSVVQGQVPGLRV